MTKRVPLAEKRRPRRELGNVLTFVLTCPFCPARPVFGVPFGEAVRVVAYRRQTVRLECRKCRLRFSVNWLDVGLKLLRDGAPGWGDASAAVGERQGLQALEAAMRGAGAWETFLEHAHSRNNGAVDTGQS